jgi:hypothetical protein
MNPKSPGVTAAANSQIELTLVKLEMAAVTSVAVTASQAMSDGTRTMAYSAASLAPTLP